MRAIAVALGCVFATASLASAQISYSVFAPLSVAQSQGGVIKASNGVLYGSGYSGGGSVCGAVYKIASDGTPTVIHPFNGANGCNPVGELVQAPDGNLYGTTYLGGPHADFTFTSGTGTVFRIVLPDETFEMVHAFAPRDAVTGFYPEGVAPYGGLTAGNDGNLYGITSAGGQTTSTLNGCGAVFQLTTAGAFTVLHSLDNDPDGCSANAGLTTGPDGNFYGTTAYGGGTLNGASGTVFKITPAGDFTRLFVFLPSAGCSCYPNGYQPVGEPVVDTAGNLYGTASAGGPGASPAGTVWKLSPGGQLTVLKAFSQNPASPLYLDGTFPFTGLTMGGDGILYGVTMGGGVNGSGVVFRVGKSGGFQQLHSFEFSQGAVPDGRLLETSPGVFIGTTRIGGGLGVAGVAFRLTVPVVDIDVNGEDGPITLGAGDPFHLTIAYHTNDAGTVNPAQIYIGVSTPFGVSWLSPDGFTTTPAAVYSGPVPTIPTATLINLPNAAALPAGTYVWFMLVDTAAADAFDYVVVTVSP